MKERVITSAALAGLLSLVAAVIALAYRNTTVGCEVAEGCDVPARGATHPFIGLGVALVVLGVLALGLAMELRRRVASGR